MFTLIRRVLCLGVLAAVAFLALSVLRGGEPIRDFGEMVKERSEQAARTADTIKDTYENVKGPAKKTVETIKATGEKIREVTGETADKAAAKARETGEKAVETAEEATGKAAGAVEAAGDKLKSLAGAGDSPKEGASGQ
ncbi:MAG: hypothetical protein Kow0025_15350 [Thermodesulfovibrionales bacterium]